MDGPWETFWVRKQYSLLPSKQGFNAWDVDRLIELSRDLPVTQMALDDLDEIDSTYWYLGGEDVPTVRSIVEHIRLTNEVDPDFPIILSASGRIMDGMHRVARALLDGRESIPAVRFIHEIEPDYRDCDPANLPY
jgi:hypothetical protein